MQGSITEKSIYIVVLNKRHNGLPKLYLSTLGFTYSKSITDAVIFTNDYLALKMATKAENIINEFISDQSSEYIGTIEIYNSFDFMF